MRTNSTFSVMKRLALAVLFVMIFGKENIDKSGLNLYEEQSLVKKFVTL